MKKIISLVLVLIFTVCLFAGCGKESGGKKADAKPMTISLKANGTTGYSWNNFESKKGIVKIETTYKQDPHDEGMVGVGGKQIYTVTPLKKGKVTLTFTYVAPGTKIIELVAVYELSVDDDLNIKEEKHYGTYFSQDNLEKSSCYVIRMPYDSTSEYRWKCEIDKKDLAEFSESSFIGTKVIANEKDHFDATQLFVIDALNPGEIMVKMTYQKEGDTEALYTAVYKLNISDKMIVTEVSESGDIF